MGVRVKLIVLIGVLAWLAAAPAAAGAFTVPTPKWAEELDQQQSEEATRRQEEAEEQKAAEEHKAAEEQKTREERSQREATERQHREETGRAEAQAKEESQREANEAAASQCVVPPLKGDTLTATRQALRQAHCKLGHVSSPHHAHGRLVVVAQSPSSASNNPAGTAVAVRLGAATRRQR